MYSAQKKLATGLCLDAKEQTPSVPTRAVEPVPKMFDLDGAAGS